MEDTGKTLLQQIREKEHEYALKLDTVKKETDAAIASAQAEAESLICTADSAAKKEAEQLYWQEKAKIEADIEDIRNNAVAVREKARKTGEENIPRAVETITRYVIME